MDRAFNLYLIYSLIIKTLTTANMDIQIYQLDTQCHLIKIINKLQGIHKYLSQDWSN